MQSFFNFGDFVSVTLRNFLCKLSRGCISNSFLSLECKFILWNWNKIILLFKTGNCPCPELHTLYSIISSEGNWEERYCMTSYCIPVLYLIVSIKMQHNRLNFRVRDPPPVPSAQSHQNYSNFLDYLHAKAHYLRGF